MAKSAEDTGPTGKLDGVLKELASHNDRLSKMLDTETDSTKRNAIVHARSALKQARSFVQQVTL